MTKALSPTSLMQCAELLWQSQGQGAAINKDVQRSSQASKYTAARF
jgi:hypothetical protein